jgi:hypothetical protein
MNRVRRRAEGLVEFFPAARKTFVRNRKRLRAGNPDDGQSAFAERRGNGGNRTWVSSSESVGQGSDHQI